VHRLRDALKNERSATTLDLAALDLARVEFPGLDVEASLSRLDNFAGQVEAELPARASPLEFILTANSLLFERFNFRGNEDDYYDPRNSCLNAVLSRRLGIPISLSVVYIEIARRLERPVAGVGLPGHFIVVYEDGASRYWVDPFHSGRILSFADCCALARETAGADLASHPASLEPLSNRQILVRMLSNLKAIYLRGQAFDKARIVLDLMIDAMPAYAEGYRQRGLVYLRQMNFRSAKSDLETFLRLDPDSTERADAEHQLLLIEHWKAGLN
jgi:regulator of sirC expression with transglutaminase-like and TPR domain